MDEGFRSARVLITGGVGFIGSNLANRLVSMGAQVTLVDSMIPEYGGNLWNIREIRHQVQVNISDVRDEHSMKYLLQDCDYLFNLAGQTSHVDSMENPQPDLEINARAQLSILEGCRRHNPNIKVVFASTRQIYGRPQYLPVDELHPIQPVDVNGINKMAGEMYHLLYCRVYGIRTAVLRLTNTYGPRMRVKDARQTFLGVWIRRLIEGQPILVYGDGKQVRDFNYVDDVIDALLLAGATDAANGAVFNLGASDPLSLEDTAKLLISIYGKGSYEMIPFPSDRAVIDIGNYYANYSKIQSRLGWEPKTSFPAGVEQTLAFYGRYSMHYWQDAHAA